MRKRLKPNHKTELPQHHIAFDTETVPEPYRADSGACVHKLMLGRAVYWRYEAGRITRERWHDFRTPRVFWDWAGGLAFARQSLWLWAHNLAFDLTALRVWELFESRQLRLDADKLCAYCRGLAGLPCRCWRGSLCTEDPPSYIQARTRDGCTVKLCDTLNWCMLPLSRLGRLVGLDKLPMPGEQGGEEDWLAYCGRDVEIVQRTVCRLLDTVREQNLGCFRYTAASQAMQLFRHLPGARRIITDSDPDHKALERLSYHAPRCEVYFAGACQAYDRNGLEAFVGVPEGMPVLTRGPAYRLDLNAAYPSVMRDNPYPVAYLGAANDISPGDLLRRMGALGACADVTIDSGSDAWPVRRPERTLWARGRFRAQLCGPELLRALKQGDVAAVHKAQFYALHRPFGPFVDKVLSWRQAARAAGDEFGARLAKLLANSLHGKFAQRAHRWELVPSRTAPVPWGVWHERNPASGRVETWRAVGWHAQRKGDGGETDDSFPLVAAYVVAYHREAMRAAVSAAGLRDVLYEDADSLHVTEPGYQSLLKRGLVSDDEPGKFKVVGTADLAIYHGVKHYRFGQERICSGLSAKAQRDAEGLWHQTEFLGLDALLSKGMPAGPISLEAVKSEPLASIPGRVNYDGWVDPCLIR